MNKTNSCSRRFKFYEGERQEKASIYVRAAKIGCKGAQSRAMG